MHQIRSGKNTYSDFYDSVRIKVICNWGQEKFIHTLKEQINLNAVVKCKLFDTTVEPLIDQLLHKAIMDLIDPHHHGFSCHRVCVFSGMPFLPFLV